MKVLALRKLFEHMGVHSGYDLLFKNLEKNIEIESVWESEKTYKKRLKNLDNSIFEGILNRKAQKHGGLKGLAEKWALSTNEQMAMNHEKHAPLSIKGFYNPSSFQAEAEFIEKLHKGNYDLAYVGYVENNFGLLANKKIRALVKCPLVGSVHQPMSWWVQRGDLELVNTLDHMIVLTEFEKRRWGKHFKGKITCVPHGVDTDFYKPDETRIPKSASVIFVGLWLRDIEALARVARIVAKKKPDITFKLVIPLKSRKNYTFQKWFFELGKLESVEWYSGISDDELLKMYQASSLTFLPMMDCTANNAVLESMACGKPIVSTSNQGLSTYLNNDFSKLYDSLAFDQMADAIIEIIVDNDLRIRMEKKSRERALELKWDNIIPEFLSVFSSLVK